MKVTLPNCRLQSCLASSNCTILTLNMVSVDIRFMSDIHLIVFLDSWSLDCCSYCCLRTGACNSGRPVNPYHDASFYRYYMPTLAGDASLVTCNEAQIMSRLYHLLTTQLRNLNFLAVRRLKVVTSYHLQLNRNPGDRINRDSLYIAPSVVSRF